MPALLAFAGGIVGADGVLENSVRSLLYSGELLRRSGSTGRHLAWGLVQEALVGATKQPVKPWLPWSACHRGLCWRAEIRTGRRAMARRKSCRHTRALASRARVCTSLSGRAPSAAHAAMQRRPLSMRPALGQVAHRTRPPPRVSASLGGSACMLC